MFRERRRQSTGLGTPEPATFRAQAAQARKYLPDWTGIAPDLESLPFNTIALADEAYLPYQSRRSMAEESMALSQVLNLSRQRNQTLIFVTQEARHVDRNIASSAAVIAFSEMGMLPPEFDRPGAQEACRPGKGVSR